MGARTVQTECRKLFFLLRCSLYSQRVFEKRAAKVLKKCATDAYLCNKS